MVGAGTAFLFWIASRIGKFSKKCDEALPGESGTTIPGDEKP